ncbi:MAG TPA: hypothetical protein DCY13_15120 [Verrucomicrobiales bacterium]|nr:hypothetical protein [Verrucomicrobiales bacterium]
MGEQLDSAPSLTQLTIPDLWQQEAVAALRDGCDVVVQAPTGSGKTLIFELWSNLGKSREQAIYTVPTRALANDKLAEWRARGWNVGIATGDLSENLDAPIIVATLETQKSRLIRGEGPKLLVVDELGYLPFEANAAHLFFQLVSRRYGRGSMLVTSNRAVSEWGGVFGDAVVATAILDRLLHHSHVITIRGDSYRLRAKRRAGLVNQASANSEPHTE